MPTWSVKGRDAEIRCRACETQEEEEDDEEEEREWQTLGHSVVKRRLPGVAFGVDVGLVLKKELQDLRVPFERDVRRRELSGERWCCRMQRVRRAWERESESETGRVGE